METGRKRILEKLISCVEDLERVIYYFERQQFFPAEKNNTIFLDDISGLFEELLKGGAVSDFISYEELLQMLKTAAAAQEQKNYILLTDIYELQILPALTFCMEQIVAGQEPELDFELIWQNFKCFQNTDPSLLEEIFGRSFMKSFSESVEEFYGFKDYFHDIIKKIREKGIEAEYTSSGKCTLVMKQEQISYYFHTNGRIGKEALLLAGEWLSQGKDTYTFYGMGMGYPYLEMLNQDENVSITVFESSWELFLLSFLFSPIFVLLESGRFQLYYDPDLMRMRETYLSINETQGFYLFYPSLAGIRDREMRKKLEEYFIEESSVRVQGEKLDRNFRQNVQAGYDSIEKLIEELRGKRVVIAAGGPSLDKNITVLKEKKENVRIIAAGTVLRRMLSEKIVPDYVIITDATSDTYGQIKGVENCGVPLIFLSTAFHRIIRDYKGKKYILCQKDYIPAERMAEHNGWHLVESGGSVITTAFDLCLRCQVKEIIFAGLDLAYTGGADHASGTDYYRKVEEDTGVMIEGITGELLQTTKTLKIYKEWIEKRIKRRTETERKITVYDATEGGARKEGMKIVKLREALS